MLPPGWPQPTSCNILSYHPAPAFASAKSSVDPPLPRPPRTYLDGACSLALCWLRAHVPERLCQGRDHPNDGPILKEWFRRRIVPERAWSIDGDVIPYDGGVVSLAHCFRQ